MAVVQQSKFLMLPRELRDDILYRVMCPIEDTVQWPLGNFRLSVDLGLKVLWTSRQLRTEGSRVLGSILSCARFVLELKVHQALTFLSQLPPELLKSIKSIWIPAMLANSIADQAQKPQSPSTNHRNLATFLRDNMRLDSVFMSTSLRPVEHPTSYVLSLLVKSLRDGILQRVCLFSEGDPSCRDALPIPEDPETHYGVSQWPIFSRCYNGQGYLRRWFWPTPTSHPAYPLIMTQEGSDPVETNVSDDEFRTINGYRRGFHANRFSYPDSCVCMYVYRKNPATFASNLGDGTRIQDADRLRLGGMHNGLPMHWIPRAPQYTVWSYKGGRWQKRL